MSYYDAQPWSSSASQPSWDQQTPPARSGASSVVPREDNGAFGGQIEEVDRAIDNLVKSGKMFNMPSRRESMPLGGGGRGTYPEFESRMGGMSNRHSTGGEFGDARTFSASNLQNFYATQRHQPSRASEAEQVMQAKRRMAAQRERELRNYHQEQQYNRSVLAELSTVGGKPDRTMSPGSGMSEEERRELIARQRSALYGEGAALSENGGFASENAVPRPGTQGSGPRDHSPFAADHFNAGQQQNGQSEGEQAPQPTGQRSRTNSNSSPSSNPTGFSLFENAAQQSSRTSASSPGGSPPRQGGKAAGTSGVAPIGTRPSISGPSQAANPALNKGRSTTPLPSPLSYGYAANEDSKNNGDRAASATANAPSNGQDVGLGGWGNKSGVWGKNPLGVQASVWG